MMSVGACCSVTYKSLTIHQPPLQFQTRSSALHSHPFATSNNSIISIKRSPPPVTQLRFRNSMYSALPDDGSGGTGGRGIGGGDDGDDSGGWNSGGDEGEGRWSFLSW